MNVMRLELAGKHEDAIEVATQAEDACRSHGDWRGVDLSRRLARVAFSLGGRGMLN